jgi:RNA polymerase sigma-70 factor, ECF subfamily
MIGITELPDEDLLRRMIAGEEDAFVALYRRRQGGIYRFAAQMSGNAILAEDVTQEVFMTLIRDPRRYDAKRGSVSAYLYGVARNHVLRRLQIERAFVPLPEEPVESGALGKSNGHAAAFPAHADDFTRAETVGQVRQAVLSLPPNYREVVVLCDLHELSYEEAAAALGCAVGTVRSRLHRGRALLLEKLRDKTKPLGKAAACSRAGR